MPLYGQEALNVFHPYMTDIQRYYVTDHIWKCTADFLSWFAQAVIMKSDEVLAVIPPPLPECSEKVNRYFLQLTRMSRGWFGIFKVRTQLKKCYCKRRRNFKLTCSRKVVKFNRFQFTGRGLIFGKVAIFSRLLLTCNYQT